MGCFGGRLGTFGDVLGDVLGCFGGRFGLFWGTFWDIFGDVFGCFGGRFGGFFGDVWGENLFKSEMTQGVLSASDSFFKKQKLISTSLVACKERIR